MKKIISLLMGICLIFVLVGCATRPENNPMAGMTEDEIMIASLIESVAPTFNNPSSVRIESGTLSYHEIGVLLACKLSETNVYGSRYGKYYAIALYPDNTIRIEEWYAIDQSYNNRAVYNFNLINDYLQEKLNVHE